MKKMYTIDGQEVVVHKKIEDGYLARAVHFSNYDEDDEDDMAYNECISDEIVYYPELFEVAPTEKFSKIVEDLKDQAERLNYEIAELKAIKSREQSLLNRVSKYPIIKQLCDYLTGDFSFVLMLKNMEVKTKGSVYHSEFVRTANIKDQGFALYKMQSSYYCDGKDERFLVFQSAEELQETAKVLLIKQIEFFNHSYNKSENLRSMFLGVHDSCLAKKDPEVLSIYNAKLSAYEKEEKEEKRKRLEKEIQDLAEKQNQLNNL